MNVLKYAALWLVSFSSGIIISGGVFGFIAVIGIVPRMAQKTKTENHIRHYENVILLGGIFGTTTMWMNYYLPIGKPLVAVYSLAMGVFIGCLAVSLAEILDVIPILTRRVRLEVGLPVFIFVLAIGKLMGSLLYFCFKGFFYY